MNNKKDLIMVVYPVYRDKCFEEEALVGQGFIFTNGRKKLKVGKWRNNE